MPSKPLDQKIRQSLEARRSEWSELAASAGLSYAWINIFMRGKIPNPGIRTLERLDEAMRKKRPRKAPAPRAAIPES